MPGKYANDTTVSVEKSKVDIERAVIRYGAEGFSVAWKDQFSRLEFVIDGRHIRMDIQLPAKDDEEFVFTDTGRERAPAAAFKSWEQGCRAVWRKKYLIIMAKLEIISSGFSTVDREFMPDIMLPDGQTVGAHTLEKIEQAYQGGSIKGLLPEFGGK